MKYKLSDITINSIVELNGVYYSTGAQMSGLVRLYKLNAQEFIIERTDTIVILHSGGTKPEAHPC